MLDTINNNYKDQTVLKSFQDENLNSNNVHHLYDDFIIRSRGSDEYTLRKAMRYNMVGVKVVQDTFTRMHNSVMMSYEAQKIIDEPNAGGASVVSEALSAEYMCRRFGAYDIVSEMRIKYFFDNWKKIDYIATIAGERVGVSVTRAMGFPHHSNFTVDDAKRLCYKKLYGLVVARSGISRQFSYGRSILHCFCQTQRIADLMKFTLCELMEEEKGKPEDMRITGNISIILTVCTNTAGIFNEDFSCITR